MDLDGRYVTNFSRLFESGRRVTEITEAVTLTADDHAGKALVVSSTAVVTLPAAAAGVNFEVHNGGSKAGEVQITLTPNGTDTIGGDGNTAANVDVVNTLATAKPGDRMILVGGSGAWTAYSVVGTWDWGS